MLHWHTQLFAKVPRNICFLRNNFMKPELLLEYLLVSFCLLASMDVILELYDFLESQCTL